MVIELIDTLNIWRKNGKIKKMTNLSNEGGLNVSEKNKTFLWLWSKCGTTHMKEIMSNFDFKYYMIRDEKLIFASNVIQQNHRCLLFKGHENYKILAAVRNPYSRFFSEFTFTNRPEKFDLTQKNKDKFEKFLEYFVSNESNFGENCYNFFYRKPDYAVRVENLFEDYSKIPFIVESDYYKSGLLKKKTEVKVNVTNEDEFLWKKFYTQQTADMVYYRMSRYFELFGYEKNSWQIRNND